MTLKNINSDYENYVSKDYVNKIYTIWIYWRDIYEKTTGKPTMSIVIPALNEEKNIEAAIKKLFD